MQSSPQPENRLPYASSGLDPTAATLPPNYRGHSCRAVAAKLVSLNLKKGEFETTSAYNDRITSLNNEHVAGATLLGDVFGFVGAEDSASDLTDQYDADNQVLKVKGYWGGDTQLLNTGSVAATKLEYKLKYQRTYSASNAYGKIVQVESSTWDTCGLAFQNLSAYSSGNKNILLDLPMEPGEARATKGKIALLYVGNLVTPYRSEYSDYLKPTIDHPREYAWSGDALVMRLSQIWLFNKATGTVYKKIEI